jgi:hypothetical protein
MWPPAAGDLRLWFAAIPAMSMIYAVYRFEVNHNLLYLSILAAGFVALALLARRARSLILLVIACAILALVPRRIDVPLYQDPGQVDDRQYFTATIPPGAVWRYTFTLNELEERRRQCGTLPPRVYIDGNRLNAETVEVRLHGAVAAEPPVFLRSNGLDQIQVTPDLTAVRQFSVDLEARPGRDPAIRLGPEVRGDQLLSDSVFLELKNPTCTVIYQTPRRVLIPAG